MLCLKTLYKIVCLFCNCFTMDATHLKFSALLTLFKKYYFLVLKDIPTRKQDNKTSQDFKGTLLISKSASVLDVGE